jgi:hydrogenase maturation factor/predicted fused transcriptional regulator/phosphomethylpyrimidine kinase
MKERRREEVEIFGKMALALNEIENCRDFASLIPEVRTNLVYAKKSAVKIEDVLAVEGRITVVDGKPESSGNLRFGASSHMARLILELNKYDTSIRAGINFACNNLIAKWLKDYSKAKGWSFGKIDRSSEPEEVKGTEGVSMPWKIKMAVESAGGKAPRLFYETGAVGKEEVAVLTGADPVEVADEICDLARAYSAGLQRSKLKVGKIDLKTFESYLLKRLGKKDKRVLVPPLTGVDAAVVEINDDKVLIIAEDPIFSIPGQPLEMYGWYTVHIGASDVAVMGVRPEFMTYTLIMPPETPEEDFKTIVNSIHETASSLRIAIVGGHTGFYPGFASPTVGGITVFSVADKGKYVTPKGARPGHDVVLTKGPAVEAVGILAVLREEELVKKYGASIVKKAQKFSKQMSVVKDSLTAMETGGVTAMHDATEGGVIGGLFEVANASSVGMEIDESKFVYPEEIKAVCEAFNIDPVAAIAEGSLILTSEPSYTKKIIKSLRNENIDASVIGKVTDNVNSRFIKRISGETEPLEIPAQDPFWPIFFEALEKE